MAPRTLRLEKLFTKQKMTSNEDADDVYKPLKRGSPTPL